MAPENGKNQKAPNGDQTLTEIKELYEFMCNESLDELEIARKDFSLKMVRNSAKQYAYMPSRFMELPKEPKTHNLQSTQPSKADLPEGESIKSPLTGTFYRSSSPKSSAFVNEGDRVQPGAVLCILEAMKVMNEIKADKPCEIVKIAVENGKIVKTGETLFIIKS